MFFYHLVVPSNSKSKVGVFEKPFSKFVLKTERKTTDHKFFWHKRPKNYSRKPTQAKSNHSNTVIIFQ